MVNFLEVCDIQGGTQPPKKDWSLEKKEGFVRMLQIRDFTQNREGKDEYVKDKSTLKKCNNADILIGRYGASIGKILTGLEGAYNVAIVKTIPDSKRLEKKYLYYFLNTIYFQNFIKNAGSRAAQAGFNKAELRDLQIPLPPLSTQKAIAEKLDQADALRKKDKELLDQYDELAQAIFIDMFGDPVKNEKGWNTRLLKESINLITYGLTVRPEYLSEGVPLISAREINSGYINYLRAPKISLNDYNKLTKKGKPKIGDILFSKTGTIGLSALVQKDTEFAITQNCARLSFIPELMNFTYALEHMRNHHFLIKCRELVKGNAVKDLQLGDLSKMEIIIPPLDIQIQFAEKIENIETQKAIVKQQAQQSEDLFQALLQESFNFNQTQDEKPQTALSSA